MDNLKTMIRNLQIPVRFDYDGDPDNENDPVLESNRPSIKFCQSLGKAGGGSREYKWFVRDGAIVSEGYGYLHHEWVGQDFDLRLMVRTTPIGNGGIFFRWKPGSLNDRGHEIQILDVPGAVVPTGSIYHYDRTNDLSLTPGKWELMQICVRDSHAWTLVNGIDCAETEGLSVVRPGYIVLQMHKDHSEVEFKDILLVPHVEHKGSIDAVP